MSTSTTTTTTLLTLCLRSSARTCADINLAPIEVCAGLSKLKLKDQVARQTHTHTETNTHFIGGPPISMHDTDDLQARTMQMQSQVSMFTTQPAAKPLRRWFTGNGYGNGAPAAAAEEEEEEGKDIRKLPTKSKSTECLVAVWIRWWWGSSSRCFNWASSTARDQ